jgi:DNA-binding NarL/FixJ family response regulator
VNRVRVLLIDDQALVRAGLSALLKSLPGVELIGEFSDAETAWMSIQAATPDVLISDIRMAPLNGIALTQRVRASRLPLPVLLLTTFEDPGLFLEARKAGAQGFLLKDASPDTLLEAILKLHRGGTLFEPKATQSISAPLPEAPKSASELGLTAREIEILKIMAGGYANKEIAAALHLAEGTVKNYVSDILSKLDCTDRTRAVLKAISQRLI